VQALEFIAILCCSFLAIAVIVFFATKPNRILHARILFAIRTTSTDKLQAPVNLNDVTTFFSRSGWGANSLALSTEINRLIKKDLIRRDIGYRLQLTNLGLIRLGRIVRSTPKYLEPKS